MKSAASASANRGAFATEVEVEQAVNCKMPATNRRILTHAVIFTWHRHLAWLQSQWGVHPIPRLLRLPNDLTVHKREDHSGLVDVGGLNLIDVAVEHHQVGQFAGSDGAFHALCELGISGPH